MIDAKFPTLDDVLDYRRRRLIADLERLDPADPEAAHEQADRLLLAYLGDEEIAAAFRKAARWCA